MSTPQSEYDYFGMVAYTANMSFLASHDGASDEARWRYVANVVREAKYVDPIAELAKDLEHEYSLGVVDNDNRSRLMLRIATRAYQLGARVKP